MSFKKTTKKHKNNLIKLIPLLSLLIILTFFKVEYQSNTKQTPTSNIAVLVDGIKQDTFPSKESGYTFESLTCENGSTGTWDRSNWRLDMTVKGPDECTVSFVTATLATVCVNQNAADCINENGMTYFSDELNNDDLDGNIRYIGSNPNNYVTFNDESWRIIGAFNVASSANGTTQKRIKLIRTEGIGSYSWDSSASGINNGIGVNEWSQADIMTTLNSGAYYNRTSGTCYSGSGETTKACDFSSTGLTNDAKALISVAYWHLGTIDGSTNTYINSTTPTMYAGERSTNIGKICSSGTNCTDTITRTTGWVGKVGLMYPSDYGYSTSGGSATNRATCLTTALYSWNGSEVSDCKNNSWLLNSSGNQWTLTSMPHLSSAYGVFDVRAAGDVSGSQARDARQIRPVVYLSANVKITGGDGTSENPYQLSI